MRESTVLDHALGSESQVSLSDRYDAGDLPLSTPSNRTGLQRPLHCKASDDIPQLKIRAASRNTRLSHAQGPRQAPPESPVEVLKVRSPGAPQLHRRSEAGWWRRSMACPCSWAVPPQPGIVTTCFVQVLQLKGSSRQQSTIGASKARVSFAQGPVEPPRVSL